MRIKATGSETVLETLVGAFPRSSRTHLKKAVRYGCVTLNGSVIRQPEFMLKAGQTVEYRKYQEREADKGRPPFKIVFEDEDIMAVVKPVGVITSGRTTEKVMSMFGMVNKYLSQRSRGRERAYTVHRLDREVGGLLLFAKSEEAKYRLQDNWTDVDKRYYALVEGVPRKAQGTLQSWLKENAAQKVYSVREEEEGAKWAVTHYRTLGYYARNGLSVADSRQALYTLLEVKLETGRKNQIRVHLSDMGNPIVGDRKYGADAAVKRLVRLYAFSIAFPHPMQDRRMGWELPIPSNFTCVNNQTEY